MCNNQFLIKVIGNNAYCERAVDRDKGIAKQEMKTGLRPSTEKWCNDCEQVMITK